MKYVKGICAGCGQERLIVHKSKKLCLGCNQRAALQRRLSRHNKRVEEGLEIDPLKLSLFYQSYWNRHSQRFCVECGIELRSFKRWHIHHLIPKKDWKLYEDDIVYSDDNCVYVCLGCHSQAETDVSKTGAIWKYAEAAKGRYKKR